MNNWLYILVLSVAIVLGVERNQNPECDVEPDMGPCKANIRMYFYNVSQSKCQIFVFGGCEGNGNRFYTEPDCLEACGGRRKKIRPASYHIGPSFPWYPFEFWTPAPIIPVIPTDPETDALETVSALAPQSDSGRTEDKCKLSPDSGPCKANFIKYFFNTLSGTCDSFIYGGCFGNGNRFNSMQDCNKNCKPGSLMKVYLPRRGFEFCFLPPMLGSCNGKLTKYYYDPETKDCKSFIHSGCNGNANRFENQIDCLKSCANSESRHPKLY